ncbi:hypothetical protein ACFQ1S_46470, partial [Kibdelosporangium lantanae]
MSAFGEWTTAEGLPAFAHNGAEITWDPIIDPLSTRHRVHVGNRRITLVAGTDGLCDLWDEHLGCRWITERTGIARLGELSGGRVLFGPTFLRTTASDPAVSFERTVLCPEERDRGAVRGLVGDR